MYVFLLLKGMQVHKSDLLGYEGKCNLLSVLTNNIEELDRLCFKLK